MTELVFLQDLVIILAAAVAVVALLRRLRVPSIAGFIVAGTVVGPHALGLVQDLDQVEMLAELGVVLLLFGIGLELSLDRVRRLWRLVALGGAVQVAATVLSVMGLSVQLVAAVVPNLLAPVHIDRYGTRAPASGAKERWRSG